MVGALVGWTVCPMQRKADKDEAVHARQWRNGVRLRGHAPAERFPSGNERQRGREQGGLRYGGAHRGLCKLRSIGPLAAPFHIRELIAQGGDVAGGEPGGYSLHERV